MSVQSTACVTLLVLLSTVMASCAGPGTGVTGNDTGGIIPYASVPPELARDLAIQHCAKYNKEPRATGVQAEYGGYYSFSCTFDARRRY